MKTGIWLLKIQYSRMKVMVSNHISTLSISGLRGVSKQLLINLEKPLTLIYGENGTGKTSICDAVDFLGNGIIGSLSDISITGAKQKYWPFLGANAVDINVYLELKGGQNWEATTTGKTVSVSNVATRPCVKVWRRKQLIDLILAKPADRFSVIKPFIDLSEIENSEQKLRDLQRQINKELNSYSERISENLSILNRFHIADDDEPQDDIEWAENQLLVPVEDVDEEISCLDSAIKQLNAYISSVSDLINTQQQVNNISITEEQAKQDYEQIKNTFDSKVEETIDVLIATEEYLQQHTDAEECPACMSKENIQGLGETISSKLEILKEVKAAKFRLGEEIRRKQAATTTLELKQQQGTTLLNALDEILKQLEIYPHSHELVSTISEIKSVPENYNVETLQDICSQLENYKSSLQESKGTRASLQSALDIYNENMQLLSESNKNKPVIDRLLEIHEEKRKAYIDDILSSIAGEVGRLYEKIHPNEGLNKIALQLDPRKRASLEIESEFLAQSVPPGAYFSNSHLDSLGLCVLIALAKLEDPENTILVMDDILGSVDEPHVDRIIELLYTESPNFLHTLVTTHYQAWHFKIRRGQLRNANCQLIELAQWNSVTGVTVRDSGRSLLTILEQCIEEYPNEPEPIASHAGHLLEQLGDFIVSKYACSVPKRVNGNTLNDYLDALKAKFIQHLKVCIKQVGDTSEDVTYIEVELSPIITELKEIYQVRNTTGAHYNDLANHLPISDILRFGELVVELSNILICPVNGFPNKQKQGAYWATTDETRQLYPLVKP